MSDLSATPETPQLEVLPHRHLLGLSNYAPEEIRLILRTARAFRGVLDRSVKKVPSLRGITCVNLFYEASTRTRLSFEIAEKRLSADVLNFASSGSSVSKGETLKDTARNIEAMRVDLVVIRHQSPGAAHFLSRCVDSVIVNAGDGSHEHPTQALLDASTIADLDLPRFRSEEVAGRLAAGDFAGLNVAIIGDVAHSRVARSNVHLLTALGANVTLCGPRTMLPPFPEELLNRDDRTGTLRLTDRLDEALEGCDIAMALRIQLERQSAGPNSLFPSVREYHTRYGLRQDHLDRYPDLIVMHPGPVNRGVEMAGEVVDSDRSVILDQVTNGVAVRMAVLFLLAGGLDR
ncbi:aspartate carbamoyltransferase catalytic subunit [soil metagenome]